MQKVLALGEILLRLSPPDYLKINQTKTFEAYYGSGEVNVLIGLAQLGLKSEFVTKIPANALGYGAVDFLNCYGVNTDKIIYGGDRLGLYFFENGYSVRASKILYDRINSSFFLSNILDYDFDSILKGVDVLHTCGITPALNKTLFTVTKRILVEAKRRGITTVCDLNYRKSLWKFEEARIKMAELMEYVDICIGLEPLQLLDSDGIDFKEKIAKDNPEQYFAKVMQIMTERFHLKAVAATMRQEHSVNEHTLQSYYYNDKKLYKSKAIDVSILDRLGTGDAFTTGVIYSHTQNFTPQETVDFANACFALKHTILGDACVFCLDEIKHFLQSNRPYSIRR